MSRVVLHMRGDPERVAAVLRAAAAAGLIHRGDLPEWAR